MASGAARRRGGDKDQPPAPGRADGRPPTPAGPRSRGNRPRGKPFLLIADDTTDARELYVEYFSSRRYVVITAHDGETAVQMALDHVPDVIVMDLAMPQIDGITAIQRIKADPRTAHTRVILLTGYPRTAIERGALQAGADRFLTKPCLPQELERHVRELR